jgi:Mg-chelatase subunit ChlD
MWVREFGADKSGATAMIWAIAVIPILMLVAGAIDFGLRENSQIKLQAVSDAAVIAGVTSLMKTGGDKEIAVEVIEDAFLANLATKNMRGGEVEPIITFPGESIIEVKVDHEVETSLMALAGVPKLRIKTLSQASFGSPLHIEAVLVLDNSLSMKGDRLSDLKTAALTFADIVLEEGDKTKKIGIVPFSNFVNVGKQYRDQFWMDVPPKYNEVQQQCSVDRKATLAEGCKQKTKPCAQDGVKSSCSYWSCPSNKKPIETCEDKTRRYRWHGCVNSRAGALNIRDSEFSTTPVPGKLTTSEGVCPTAILPLNYDAAKVDDHINALTARGETYMATGITWGIRVLSPSAPFDQGAVPVKGENQNKIMVILSDGENSRSRHPKNGGHWSTNKKHADAATVAACKEAEESGIIVYTIAFNVTDADTLKFLEDCAGDPERFYQEIDADGMLNAFKTIGKEFKNLALTR